MRKAIAILLAILFLMLSMKDLVMYASFKINQDYIADNFCENKDEPEVVMCYGTCFLKDKIEAEHQDSEQSPMQEIDEYKELTVFLHTFESNKMTFRQTVPQRITFDAVPYSSSYLSSLLRPPQEFV